MADIDGISMRRSIRPALTAVLCLLVGLLPGLLFADLLVVTVKLTSVRIDKQFYARSKASASYGESLTLINSDRDWHKVKYKNTSGWVHNSAVALKSPAKKKKKKKKEKSAKPSTFSGLSQKLGLGLKQKPASNSTAGYSQDDVTLAGKGFSEEVEKNYRSNNPNINYKDVNWVEKQRAPANRVLNFAKAGNLSARALTAPTKEAAKPKQNTKTKPEKTDSSNDSVLQKAKKRTSGFFKKLKPGSKDNKDSGGNE